LKTIFITGSSSGLGKATAKLFAAQGWKVIATMRHPEKETELSQLDNVVLLPLEVTNPEQIRDTVERSIALGEVDVVFNNAAYGLGGPLESYSDAQIERQIDTNLLGVIRVTQAFIPHFRAKKSGLFITTTSIGGRITFPFFSVYCATKWALEGFSESLAFELNKFGIGVKTISPGGIKTDFGGRSMDRAQHEDYDKLFNAMYSVLAAPENRAKGSLPEQIAEVVYEAATDGKDQLRYLAGKDAKEYYNRRLEQGDEVFRKDFDQILFGNRAAIDLDRHF
jgi:NAD(P)-dependent dehydrogenase (short-subunit alcohol dehydrogenase family)